MLKSLKDIKNLSITNVKVIDGNLRYKVKKQDINKIKGLKILKIERRSKYLLFFFNKNILMTVHLGMTGKFFIIKNNNQKKKTSFYYKIENISRKHDRVIFFFNKKIQLVFNDIRKFGFIKIFKSNEIKNIKNIKTLGPEPLSEYYNFKYFKKYLIGRNRKIKDLLMDQKFVSGLGNIYVNEILFFSKIRPNRNINKLQIFEIKNIIFNTKKVLKKAILYGGSSIKNFSNSEGKKGSFQEHFNVYGKLGFKCPNSGCKETIKKINISNRTSLFCQKCQK